ncbi:MAG TPA: HlyD family efflux transporter periplasmic adaptor subunit [Longimicrobiaceae bacterium]|nr:HlyD family efflux transporter periplasmic adaptor subunit [Longimicrobiaceae bacterium]
MDIPRTNARKSRRWVWIAAGVAGVIVASLALAKVRPAAPSIDSATVFRDTVRRGEMLRQVRGPGTLVSQDIRWISAVTQGRVEQKAVEPGTEVKAGTVLLVLSNPDVERSALEAERQLRSAEAELTTLRVTLQGQVLSQESSASQLQAQYNEAVRVARSSEGLAQRELISRQEVERARDNAEDLRTRLAVERERLGQQRSSLQAQLAAQQAQVEMLRRLATFSQQQIASMQVRSPQDGVLQELPVELGQWVQSGGLLAKVVQPGRLKAVLRIPETQARDVALGQPASVDTHNGVVAGHVVRIDPASQNGTVSVDVALDGPLPRGARPDLSVDGTIEFERLRDVVYVGRPAYGQAEGSLAMFRVLPGGHEAERVMVTLGRGSAGTIEIKGGARPGDVLILSDMSQYESYPRVRLK